MTELSFLSMIPSLDSWWREGSSPLFEIGCDVMPVLMQGSPLTETEER